MHRFYLTPDKLSANPLELKDQEFHHLTHVLRAKVGSHLTIFDGAGTECHCSVAELSPEKARLNVIQRARTPALPYAITLAQALPKGAAMDMIVEKATELGARVIQPLSSERSVTKLALEESDKRHARWQQISIEAAKQCGNNWLPDIAPLQSAGEFLRQPLKYDLKLIGSLQPGAQSLRQIVQTNAPALQHSSTPSALLLIGPEGDFTPAELSAALSAGCLPLSLGPLILRSETAAIASLTLLAYELALASEAAKR